MKTYLITGAAQGLGKALANALIQANHQVILLDKELKRLNAFYDEIAASDMNIDLVALYPMDLLGANIENYKEFHNILKQEYGQLDGVFLNAAILPAFTPIEHFDYTQWYEVLHTNLNANFHLIQQTLPLLRNAENGALVAIGDNNINKHPAYYGAYGVAKAGLKQLMTSTAYENRNSGINCYFAELESFATEARGRLFPGENPNDLNQVEDIAEFILGTILEKQETTETVDFGVIEKL
ncbi:SDR family NAD(P)-dependent oxidoreductase [Thiomicrorhabdus sediminis]|uniref:SDR family NAD(P)-dependent oxidoreductase n=1 Tax=Thiomicrorhabdus sediminis TaxID=2580412 RepID=A0A4P9K5M1_9GAMM|nr:SDR family NAD(P)-dependent oxidoreductase [Thiomicrorhabdus sediminis]QCU90101.1 SDR family NAD(P)-dependent oxidoreductase [Thiomicrorhabdus sediminis]